MKNSMTSIMENNQTSENILSSETIQTSDNAQNSTNRTSPQRSLLGAHPSSNLKQTRATYTKRSSYYAGKKQPGTDMILDGKFLIAKNDKYGKLTFYFAIENEADVKRINAFIEKHKNNPEYKYPFWKSEKDNTQMLTVKGTNELVRNYPDMKGQETYRMTVSLKPYVFNGYSGFSATVTEITV